METEPFAILEWKHTLNRISIVRVHAPRDCEPAPCNAAGLEVLIYSDVSFSYRNLQEFSSRLRSIMIGAEASVEIRICRSATQPSCQEVPAHMRSVQGRIIREPKVLPMGVTKAALGYSVAGSQGGPYGVDSPRCNQASGKRRECAADDACRLRGGT